MYAGPKLERALHKASPCSKETNRGAPKEDPRRDPKER